jgi:S-adenosylmethionine hydrolase
MPLITLLTDFGDSDYYVASVKAGLLGIKPELVLIDISHSVPKFNIPHAAYVLKAVFHDFPLGTIHLVSINGQTGRGDICILAKIEGHFFLSDDHALLSLISDYEPELVVKLFVPEIGYGTFSAKTVLVPAILKLCDGVAPEKLGEILPGLQTMFNRHPRLTHNQIIGQVIHIDSYGNLITNIEKKVFEKLGKGRSFILSFSREKISHLSQQYSNVQPGNCTALFNHTGSLEIFINMGNASELLGMYYESPVMFTFEGE